MKRSSAGAMVSGLSVIFVMTEITADTVDAVKTDEITPLASARACRGYHAFLAGFRPKDVDGRDKPGHDSERIVQYDRNALRNAAGLHRSVSLSSSPRFGGEAFSVRSGSRGGQSPK